MLHALQSIPKLAGEVSDAIVETIR